MTSDITQYLPFYPSRSKKMICTIYVEMLCAFNGPSEGALALFMAVGSNEHLSRGLM